MNRESYLKTIKEKALVHLAKYPTFDLTGYMEWISHKSNLRHYASRSVSQNNKSRKKQKSWDRFVSVDFSEIVDNSDKTNEIELTLEEQIQYDDIWAT